MRERHTRPIFNGMPANETALPRAPRRGAARALIPAFVACALTLGLTACTPDGPATPPTTGSTASPAGPATTPAPTATPTPTADPNPADLAPLPADEIDASFVTVENFFKAYEYGLKTGDDAPYRGLYTSECGRCEAIAVNISTVAEDGAPARGGKFTFTRAELLNSTESRRIVWRLNLRQEPTRFTHRDGSTSKTNGFDGMSLLEVSTEGKFKISGIA